MSGSKRTEYEIAIEIGGKVAASLGDSITSAGKNLDSLVNMAKSVGDGMANMAKATDNSVSDMNRNFDSLVETTNSAGSSLDGLVNMAESAAKMLAGAFAALKVGQFVGDAVGTYTEFEQSMANTAATANATRYQYEMLEAAAREMGKATTKTAAEASDALGYMMLAGWSVNDAISGLEPVLRLSEATQMDLATCSDLVTDSMSALGLSVDGLSGYLDMCTAANNNANTTAEALMEAFIGCGGAAKTVGADLNDMATALGVLANNGTKGAQAGTAMNSMLVRMTSKDTALNAMKKLGVAVFDDAGEFRGLQRVLVDLQGALSSLTTEEQAAYMSSIAGTNYYTEMGYLLDAVATKADGTANAWETLSLSLEDSDGALMNMAGTVTDTLQGAFSRLESATDDAKISLADAFSDDLKNTINDLSEHIPVLTQNFIDFADKASPKISKAFATARKAAGGAWGVISSFGSWAIDNFGTLEKVIAGAGGAIATYKVANKLVDIAGAVKGVGTALKAVTVSNPWLLGITLAASAIVGVAAAFKTAERQAAKSNLADHFGNIALSMEDISNVAEYIVASDNLNKIRESMGAFSELDGIADSMSRSIASVNKMNWKVSIGMKLSADEQEAYISAIQNYVSQAQAYVEQEQYALNLNLAFFAEGDLERQNIVDQLNDFYSGKYSELHDLGTQLNEAVTEAFQDGLLDPDEAAVIANLQSKMARIQEALATSDFDAKLKVMELQYSGADLDSKSFLALQEELAVQVEAASAQYEESLQLRIANQKVMLDDGAIDRSQYDAAINEFWEDYLTSMSELEAKSLDFQINTVMQQYSDDVAAFQANMNDVMAEYANEFYAYEWTDRTAITWDSMIRSLYDNDISTDTKNAIAMLLKSMQPSIEQVEQLKKQYEDLGMEIPKSLQETLANADLLGAMTAYEKWYGTKGDVASVWKVAENYVVNDADYEAIEQTLRGYGWELPEAVAEELEASQTETIAPAINGMYAYSDEYIKEVFSQGFEVAAAVNVTMTPSHLLPAALGLTTGGQVQAIGQPQVGHAEGGIFDTPHVAWFAEDGPEAAIPLDGSSNALSLWEEAGHLLGVFDGGMNGARESLHGRAATYENMGGSTTEDYLESQIASSPDYGGLETSLREKNWGLPEAMAERIEAAQGEAIPQAVRGMYAYSQEYLEEVFSQGFDVPAEANVAMKLYCPLLGMPGLPTGGQAQAIGRHQVGHAEGGIFDTPHMAWFAEDGPEAAIPLNGSSNALSLWEEVGQLLGVFDGGMKSTTERLYARSAAYENAGNSSAEESAGSWQFVFAPQITIEGNASQEDIGDILGDKMEEFCEMLEQYMAEKNRVSFG